MFHGITGDDAVKGKVRASQVGEGFDPSEAEKSKKNVAYFIGGPFVHTANLFGTGFGPVDESVEVNGEYPYAYDDESSVGWYLPLNAEYRSAPTDALLRSSRVLASPASFDEDGNYSLNEDALKAVKSELYQGHGVSLALKTAHNGFNAKYRAVYYEGENVSDHAVTVVGYDDNFPKENFTRKNSSGTEIKGSTPPADGAFIIKNSRGLSSHDGDIDDGYFYLSYYDQSINSPLSFVFDSKKAVKHAAPNYDQYDLMMTEWYGSTDYDNETKMANVFDAEEDESLYQIAYRTSADDTEVTYEIYKDVKDGDPASGTLLETGVNSHALTGFYKIDLKDEYALKKGEKYSVVLTMKRDADGGEVYTEVFPYSTEFYDGMTVTGIVNQGESYLYTDGKWSDMSSLKDSLAERAYQQCVRILASDYPDVEIEVQGKDKMALDNYPIKAILAPAA